MLVSAIGKLNAVKTVNNNLRNTFSGDKNFDMLEKCKPHYKSNSRLPENEGEEQKQASEEGKKLSLLI